jgi:hypothetical protein
MFHRAQRTLSRLRSRLSVPVQTARHRTPLAVELLERRDAPALWIGAGPDNLASDAANWSGDVVPGPSDTGILDGTCNKPIDFDRAFILAQLQIRSSYNSTVEIDVSVTITDYLLQASSTIINGEALSGGGSGGGSIGNGGPGGDPGLLELTGSASYDWTAGGYQGSGTLLLDAGATANMVGTLTDTGWDIANNGAVTWADGVFAASHVAFSNNPGAVMLTVGNLTWYDPATDGGVFINQGTFQLAGNLLFTSCLHLQDGCLVGVGGELEVTSYSSVTWWHGPIDGIGAMQIDVQATFDVHGTTDLELSGWTITNDGTSDWTGGRIVSSLTTFHNPIGVVWAGAGALAWLDPSNSTTFNNGGQLNVASRGTR